MSHLLSEGHIPSVLINNAGAAYTGDLLAMPLDRWQWMLQLNLTSVMQVCAAVVPSMRSQGGLVINVSSHAAHNAFPQWGAYCVSKAALVRFTRCLAAEERPHGIRACTLTLGARIHPSGTKKPYKVISIVAMLTVEGQPMPWCIWLCNPPIRSSKTSL